MSGELLHCQGVTVESANRISAVEGHLAWASGAFVTLVETSDEQGWNQYSHVQTKRNVCCLALSPDGTRIATGEAGKDPCIRVWCRDSKKYTNKLKSHKFEIVNVAWHPEGRHLVSCGNIYDRQIIVWSLKTNGMIATSRLTAEPRFMVFFGKESLVTVGKGLIRFWTFPRNAETRVNTRTRALQGHNVMLKQRKDATFVDCCQTKKAIYAVAQDGIGKVTRTRSLQKWRELADCRCVTESAGILFVGLAGDGTDDSIACIVGLDEEFEIVSQLSFAEIVPIQESHRKKCLKSDHCIDCV